MGGGTGTKGGYKGDDAEGMYAVSLEPDPRYTGCCNNVCRPGRIMRDILVGLLVLLAIAVVIIVLFLVCYYALQGDTGKLHEGEASEGAFRGGPREDEIEINEVTITDEDRYDVSPENIKELEHGHDHDHAGHDHDHDHDHDGHSHDHAGHDHDHAGHDHGHDHAGHDHDHAHEHGADHDHGHMGADHEHTGPGHDHEHTHTHEHEHDHTGPHAHDHDHPVEGTHSHPHDHDHTHPHDHDHGAQPEPTVPAEGAGELEPVSVGEFVPTAENQPAGGGHEADGTQYVWPPSPPTVVVSHTHEATVAGADADVIVEIPAPTATVDVDIATVAPVLPGLHAEAEAPVNETDALSVVTGPVLATVAPELPAPFPPSPDGGEGDASGKLVIDLSGHGPIVEVEGPQPDFTPGLPERTEAHDATVHLEETGRASSVDDSPLSPLLNILNPSPNPGNTSFHLVSSEGPVFASPGPEGVKPTETLQLADLLSPILKPTDTLPVLSPGSIQATAEPNRVTMVPHEGDGGELTTVAEAEVDPTFVTDPIESFLQGVGKTVTEEIIPGFIPDDNFKQGECRPRRLEMCKDVLPYEFTALPNIINNRNQQDLMKSLPYFQQILIGSACSSRSLEYACAMLEPPCLNDPVTGNSTTLPPCRSFCKSIASTCFEFVRGLDVTMFECGRFPESSDPNVCVHFAVEPVNVTARHPVVVSPVLLHEVAHIIDEFGKSTVPEVHIPVDGNDPASSNVSDALTRANTSIVSLAGVKVPTDEINVSFVDLPEAHIPGVTVNVPDIHSETPIVDTNLPSIEFTKQETPTIEGQIVSVEGQLPTVEAKLPSTHGQVSSGEGQLSSTGGQIPTIEGELPTVEAKLPSVEGEVLSSEGQLFAINEQLPKTEDQLPTIKAELPTVEGTLLNVKGELAIIEGQLPSIKAELPTVEETLFNIEGELPTIEGRLPIIEGESASNVELPIFEGQLPTISGQPTIEGQLPKIEETANINVKLSEGEPTIGVELPTIEGKLPVSEGQLPTIEGQLPTIERELPTIDGQLFSVDAQVPAIKEGASIEVKPPTFEVETPTFEGELPNTEVVLPTTDTKLPTFETNLPTTEAELPPITGKVLHSETKLPSLQGLIPTIEEKVHAFIDQFPGIREDRSGLQEELHGTESELLTIQGKVPTKDQEHFPVDGTHSSVKVQLPSIEGQLSMGEEQLSTNEGAHLNIEGKLPTLEGEIPTVEVKLPTIEEQVHSLQEEFPKGAEQVFTQEGSLTSIQDETPASISELTPQKQTSTVEEKHIDIEGQLPTVEVKLPTAEGQFPTLQEDLPADETPAATTEGQLFILEGRFPFVQDEDIFQPEEFLTLQEQNHNLQGSLSSPEKNIHLAEESSDDQPTQTESLLTIPISVDVSGVSDSAPDTENHANSPIIQIVDKIPSSEIQASATDSPITNIEIIQISNTSGLPVTVTEESTGTVEEEPEVVTTLAP